VKISIGTNIKDGPWGGGNLFAKNLTNYLIKNGHEVIYDLNDSNIDIILMTEPRKTSESSAFTNYDIQKYLAYENNHALVVHRINECDERKMTNFVNKYLLNANKVADATIYVSSWIMNIFHKLGIDKKDNFVVLAGANKEVFNNIGYKPKKEKEKFKIVTHHWGANKNKGFYIYELLDNLLNEKKWSEKIEFKYIGNLPKQFNFKNAEYVEPLSGEMLANEIKKSHIYLTASINEPSGNHHIEGAQCGLPLLYIESGGIPEYCFGYGVGFNHENFIEKLSFMINNYEEELAKVAKYPRNSEIMSEEFLKIFQNLIQNRDVIIKNRSNNFNYGKFDALSYKISKKMHNLIKNK
tara:strand:+ start:9960 stop:11018 length:1059 start_codon:yes stop_codon:yes gene_type:complete